MGRQGDTANEKPEGEVFPVLVLNNQGLTSAHKRRPDLDNPLIDPDIDLSVLRAGNVYDAGNGQIFEISMPRHDSLKLILYCGMCAMEKYDFETISKMAREGKPVRVTVDLRDFRKKAGYKRNSLSSIKEQFILFQKTFQTAQQYIYIPSSGRPPAMFQLITSVVSVAENMWEVTFNSDYLKLFPAAYFVAPSSILHIDTYTYESALSMAYYICVHVCRNQGKPHQYRIKLSTLLEYTAIKFSKDAGRRVRAQVIRPAVKNLRVAANHVLKVFRIFDERDENKVFVSVNQTTTNEENNRQWEELSKYLTEEKCNDLVLEFDTICELVDAKRRTVADDSTFTEKQRKEIKRLANATVKKAMQEQETDTRKLPPSPRGKKQLTPD